MKQLLKKPFLLALILSLPLWIVFNNYIVAICVALLVAFLLAMIDSIIVVQRQQHRSQDPSQQGQARDPSSTDSDR